MERFSREELLIGTSKLNKLKNSKVAIFGVGGVGGYALEGLVRLGVGSFLIVDSDVVDITNFNRQILATTESIGRDKVEVAKERALSINPDAKIEVKKFFYLPENADEIDLSKYDYIVDCIDTISAKIELVKRAKALNVSIISSMGTGNKLNPFLFKIAKIKDTKVCPLCSVMRRELKKIGILDLEVLYSEEEPQKIVTEEGRKKTVSSISFMPSVAGLLISSKVFESLL